MVEPAGSLEAVTDGEKRGRGRPPLNPEGGDTTPLRIRLSNANLETLGRVIAQGLAKNASDAVRWIVDNYEKREKK